MTGPVELHELLGGCSLWELSTDAGPVVVILPRGGTPEQLGERIHAASGALALSTAKACLEYAFRMQPRLARSLPGVRLADIFRRLPS